MSIPSECQQLRFPAGSEPRGHVMASSQPVWKKSHDFRASHRQQQKKTFQLCNLVIPVAGIWYTWELQKAKWTLPVFQAFVNPNSLPGSHIWNTLDQIAFGAQQNIWSCEFTHTHTHTQTHAHTNTRTHTHTRTHSKMFTAMRKQTLLRWIPWWLRWHEMQKRFRNDVRRRLTVWCKTKWYSHIVSFK